MRVFLLVLSAVLLIAWIGSVVLYALGGLLHILLVLAIVTFFLSRRKTALPSERRKKIPTDELDKRIDQKD